MVLKVQLGFLFQKTDGFKSIIKPLVDLSFSLHLYRFEFHFNQCFPLLAMVSLGLVGFLFLFLTCCLLTVLQLDIFSSPDYLILLTRIFIFPQGEIIQDCRFVFFCLFVCFLGFFFVFCFFCQSLILSPRLEYSGTILAHWDCSFLHLADRSSRTNLARMFSLVQIKECFRKGLLPSATAATAVASAMGGRKLTLWPDRIRFCLFFRFIFTLG